MQNTSKQAFVLDIGSASVRLIVGEPGKSGQIKILNNSGCVTNLLRNSGISGFSADSEAVRLVLSVIKNLVSNVVGGLPKQGAVLCTQAIRQVADSEHFLNCLYSLTGIFPEVLTGEREGQLALKGSEHLVGKNGILIDLGGGSTEIIVREHGVADRIQSFPVGAGVMPKTETPKVKGLSDHISDYHRHWSEYWEEMLQTFRFPDINVCVVLGGTASNLISIYYGYRPRDPESFDGKTISLRELQTTASVLTCLSEAERSDLPGLEKGRESIIVNGAFILISLCEMLGVESVTISERGIRYGRLIELLQAEF